MAQCDRPQHKDEIIFPPIIVIEGNISAGKTTLLGAIEQRYSTTDYSVLCFTEPLAADIPYLKAFYENPEKYIYKLQHWFMARRLQNFHELIERVRGSNEKKVDAIIMDRCIYSDAVFLANALDTGIITQPDYDVFMSTREIVQCDMPKPTVLIHLNTTPNECFKRVHEIRQEESENSITLEYLHGIDRCYDDYLKSMEKQGVAVVSFEWNSFENTDGVFKKIDAILASTHKA